MESKTKQKTYCMGRETLNFLPNEKCLITELVF